MDQILSVVIDLVQNGPEFEQIGFYLIYYFLILWVAFSVWVGIDAYKRYDNIFFAIIWFLVVLVLNFPFLIFYVMVRPEHMHEYISDTYGDDAVNIPLANFVGEKGVDMQINLKINSRALNTDTLQNIKLGIDLEGVEATKEVSNHDKKESNTVKEEKEPSIWGNIISAIKNFWADLKEGLQELKSDNEIEKEAENDDFADKDNSDEEQSDNNDENSNKSNKYKSKKKKKKNRR